MTIFSNNPYDRRMEQLMMTVPNFAPRGVGFRFTEAQIFITATAATPTEILTATMRQIRCPPFRKRFNEYIESEENPMTYINEKHRTRFTLASKNVHRENYALLSALYLLTADQRLWSCCKHHINNGCVFFENIKLNGCSERAYCRVSTKQEEQLNSYENQVEHYTHRINAENGWTLEGIYADKGISGTSVKKRDEFNRMIRRCKQGKIDMIITKSIARFARNTVDCLKYVRLLNDLGVDVYFEEQGIHSNQPGAEFYITIYGSIAQSESENISANIKWGKAQAAREGKVVFRYKNFLGYRKGEDGQPEIVPEEAETIRFIYDRFLAGDSLKGIAKLLEEKGIKSPTGKAEWQFSTIQSILSNERYKGDAIINKTYITDCISKKVRVNNGERPKYYVENSHPAIIDSATFGRVQEELARRSGKRKISRKAKTEQGKYSSKYALTELLVCGECKSAYRRCTWTAGGKKKIVWRCINRIEYAKKYCHNSPSVEESVLQRAVMAAIMETANQNAEVLRTLKLHIGMGLAGEKSVDNSIDLQIRIAEIDAEFKKMLDRVSTDTIEAFDEETATRLMNKKSRLQQQLDSIADAEQRRENAKSRLDDIYTILDGIKNRPMEYDDQIVRQLLECVVVDSKEQITVIFKGGLKSVQPLTE